MNSIVYKDHCFVCRNRLTKETNTEEHVFPKWLLRKYNLFDQNLTLLNKTTIPYRYFTVPCCKVCNGTKMSHLEDLICKAVDGGYDEFVKLDKDVVAWWLAKIYYCHLLKETNLFKNRANPSDGYIFDAKFMKELELIHTIMKDIHDEKKHQCKRPYDLFIFKSNEYKFDYLDSFVSGVCYMHIENIIIVCSLTSFGKCEEFFKNEIDILNN